MFTARFGISKRRALTAAATAAVSAAAVIAIAPGADASAWYENPAVGYVECPASAPVVIIADVWYCAQNAEGAGITQPLASYYVPTGVGRQLGYPVPTEAINVVPSILGQPSIWVIEDDSPFVI